MKSKKQTGQILTLPVMLGGSMVLIAALLTKWAVGSPLFLLHKMNAAVILPPLWLMSLIWMAFYFLMGAATGYLLSVPSGNALREVCLWRGCTFLVLAVVFSLVWYTLLFGKLYLFPSGAMLLLSILAALVCTRSWWQIGKWSALISLGFAMWHICLFFLQFAVLLHL